jgi:hypothetical protein
MMIVSKNILLTIRDGCDDGSEEIVIVNCHLCIY